MSALDDIKKYVSNPDEAVMASMGKTYALALSNADARQVSFSDPAELKTVRENFVKGKLGVADSDADIDAAIKAVGEHEATVRLRDDLTAVIILQVVAAK